MEKYYKTARKSLAVLTLSGLALTACSIDSYLTDESDVRCDGLRTKSNLVDGGMTTFIVHGEFGKAAAIQLIRDEQTVVVGVSDAIELELEDSQTYGISNFSDPITVVEGAEITEFVAGGAWIIDVRDESATIKGSCG